ncbi:Bifunctional protein GlmU [Bienertia sinuspersici]
MSQRWRWFCWKLVYNTLPMRHNLWKRKICSTSSCAFCGKMETTSHLLIHSNAHIRVSSWFRNTFFYLFKTRTNRTQSWLEKRRSNGIKSLIKIILYQTKLVFLPRMLVWPTPQGWQSGAGDSAWKKNALTENVVAAFGWVLEVNGNTINSDSNRICAILPLQAECHALLRGIGAAARDIVVLVRSFRFVNVVKCSRVGFNKAHKLALKARKGE